MITINIVYSLVAPYVSRNLRTRGGRGGDRVLANLRFNVETNRAALKELTGADPNVTVQALDWTDFTASSETAGSEPEATAPRDNDHSELTTGNKRAPAGGFDLPVGGGGTGAGDGDGDGVGCSRDAGQVGGITVDDALGTPEVVLAADVVYDLT